MKEVKLDLINDTLVVRILCEIDHHTARRIRDAADEGLRTERIKTLELDFSAVTFMDSSGIGLVMGRVDTARRIGVTVKVSGLSPKIYRLFRMAGLERLEGLTFKESGLVKK